MTTRIFLSYGRGDDHPDFYDPAKSFMRRLYNGLKAAGFEVWWDRESLPSRALSFLQEIRDAVTASDKLVLVVGEKGMASDYVRAEYEYALSICKTVVPILRNCDYSIMPPEIAFANAPDFRDSALFDQKLAELIRFLNEDDAPMGNLYNVSDLPRGYIERKADMQAVSAMIRSDAVKPTVVTAVQGRAAALYGLGGIGKTVLTRALCYDCDLRRSFPDGIIWLEIGKTPLITSRQADIGEIFGDSRDKYIDEKAGKSRLSQILSDKKAIIILDDIWEQEHVEHFRVFAQGCRLLITTRIQRLANTLGANNYELDKLSEEQGIQLIAARFDKKLGEFAEIDILREMVILLDGHTLAISIAASKLEEHGIEYAPRLLERMKSRREGENPFLDLVLDQSDRNSNLELSLSLTYDDLTDDLKRRFHGLGILAPDASFDTKLAAAIWNDAEENIYETEDSLNVLVQIGLLTRETPTNNNLPDGSVSNFKASLADNSKGRMSLLIRMAEALGSTIHTLEKGMGGIFRFSQHGLVRAYARALLIRTQNLDSHFTRYTDTIIKFSEGFRKLPAELWKNLEIESSHIIYVGDTLYDRYSSRSHPNSNLENLTLQFVTNITIYLAYRREIHRVTWFHAGIEIANRQGDQKTEALFLDQVGIIHNIMGDKAKAVDYYHQALQLRQQVNDQNGEAQTLNNIGNVYYALGEKTKALDFYLQALPVNRAIHNQVGESHNLNNIGTIYNALGEKTKALDFYLQALPLVQTIGDQSSEAVTLNNLGEISLSLGKRQEALEYFQQALPLLQRVGNMDVEAIVLSNLGSVYDELQERTKAIDYYLQALPLIQAIGNRNSEATVLNNLGFIYATIGEQTKALDYYLQALPLRRAVGDQRGEVITLNNIAGIYCMIGEISRAVDTWKETIATCVRLKDVISEATQRFNRAFALAKLGRTTEACAELEQSINILKHYNLQHDGAGQTLAEHEALLAQLRGGSPPLLSPKEVYLLKRLLNERGEVAVRLKLAQAHMSSEAIKAILTQLRAEQNKKSDFLERLFRRK